MRRSEREITNWPELVDVLRRANTIRLGIKADSFPYVVPLSFGFEEAGGQIVIYFHCAKEGRKNTLLKNDNHVCVEASIFHKFTATATNPTTEYESVIGCGLAEIVQGEEAVKGLNLICSHCGFPGHEFDHSALEHLLVYKIMLSSVSGKRNLR